ncbi:MAG: asparaginase [Tannerellaceae bacterium]|jgi:L-asparaginase|nr:asparaginase [Tannerellaceae bacterium]
MQPNTKFPSEKASILLIYTGGTIGMRENPETSALESIDFSHLHDNLPELQKLGHKISTYQFNPPLDSSDIGLAGWQELVRIISTEYERFDGFVILHGTDTMSFTASALSFMLENLGKPVIFTGSQLPISVLRTDGKENLITAIEIAAASENGLPLVPEVCIFFENALLRGNRTRKISANNFSAFRSFNYPPLASAGVHIRYEQQYINRIPGHLPLRPHYSMDNNIAILKLFPGITMNVVEHILNIPELKGMVLETFGSGNAPRAATFLRLIKEAIEKGIVIVNVTQCLGGSVEMQRYETGRELLETGVVSGYDITAESAVVKLMYLFGQGMSVAEVKENLNRSLVGEISLPSI